MSVVKVCECCGNSFVVKWPSRAKYRRFCSHKCQYKSVPKIPLAKRFWAKVDKSTNKDCWDWGGAVGINGYGRISRGDGTGKDSFAHRVSWEIHCGPIPEGMYVLHKCDNPSCVNPAHLFLGTMADNAKDKVRKGRSTFGEKNINAKLTEKEVIEIRQLYATGEYTHEKLSEQFGVSRVMIGYIVKGRNWKHVHKKKDAKETNEREREIALLRKLKAKYPGV